MFADYDFPVICMLWSQLNAKLTAVAIYIYIATFCIISQFLVAVPLYSGYRLWYRVKAVGCRQARCKHLWHSPGPNTYVSTPWH